MSGLFRDALWWRDASPGADAVVVGAVVAAAAGAVFLVLGAAA
jgi:hypothetical protein